MKPVWSKGSSGSGEGGWGGVKGRSDVERSKGVS